MGERAFSSLAELYAALEREDDPPPDHFSEKLVFGEGPASACLALVGEQPGDQEDRTGRPFVGPAGQLLTASLEEAGIEREAVFLTNAVKRFKFTLRGKRRIHARPTTAEIVHYRWWLMREIELVSPMVVIALGATALQALTGARQTLASVRGHPVPWDQKPLLFATIHPSFLLRIRDAANRASQRHAFIENLRQAARCVSAKTAK